MSCTRGARQQLCLRLHVLEHMEDICPFVQILDLPLPQTVDNVTDALRVLDLTVADQVIDVPMISSSSCPSRVVLLEPQMAEQLVEVPTVLSVVVLQQQTVERPLTFQFLMVVVVEQRLVLCRALTSPFVEAFTVFSPRQRSTHCPAAR